MSGIYNLLDYITTYEMSNGVNGAPLSTWEVSGSSLVTINPVSMTRPNTSAQWRPYPYLEGAIYDLSSVAEPNSIARGRCRGTITKDALITSVGAFDSIVPVVDEGDHYSFETNWGPDSVVGDPANFFFITAFSMFGPSPGALSVSGIEANVIFEIQIDDPPPPENITVRSRWSIVSIKRNGVCGSLPSSVTFTSIYSAILTIFPPEAAIEGYRTDCLDFDVVFDTPGTEYVIDPTTINMTSDGDYDLVMSGFSHPELFQNSIAKLYLRVNITVDGWPIQIPIFAIYTGG